MDRLANVKYLMMNAKMLGLDLFVWAEDHVNAKWMGKNARRHDSDILKQSIFDTSGGPLQPREPSGPRKRGRPKISWIKGVLEHATAAAGSRGNLIALLSSSASEYAWNKAVYGYCRK